MCSIGVQDNFGGLGELWKFIRPVLEVQVMSSRGALPALAAGSTGSLVQTGAELNGDVVPSVFPNASCFLPGSSDDVLNSPLASPLGLQLLTVTLFSCTSIVLFCCCLWNTPPPPS